MNLLLIVRGLAALAVVVWHVTGFRGEYPAVLNVPGRTAVWLFFGMSGYVIAHGFIHKRYQLNTADLRDFYINRLLRIYPIFLLLSILGWLAEYLLSGVSPLALTDIPSQLMAFQFDQNYILSGVFWTLGIEMHFYLLAPLFVLPLLLNERKQQLLIGLGMYAASIFWIYFSITHLGGSSDGRNVLMNLPHFLAGMIACRFVADFKPSQSRLVLSIAGAVFLLMLSNYAYHRLPGVYWSKFSFGVILVDMSVLLLILAHVSFPQGEHNARFRTFTLLGTLSYGIYAWHPYLMKYIPQLEGHLLLVMAASILAAYISYRFVEVPALMLKRRHSECLI